MARSCTCCGKEQRLDYDWMLHGSWWNLSDYFGLFGYFCPECYEKVSHDPYGKPRHPEQYTMILLRMGK